MTSLVLFSLLLLALFPTLTLQRSVLDPAETGSGSVRIDEPLLRAISIRNKTVFAMIADNGVKPQAAMTIRSFNLLFPQHKLLVLVFTQPLIKWCLGFKGTVCRFVPHESPICEYTEGDAIFNGPKRFGTMVFRLIQKCKQNALLQILLHGYNVFFLDSDSVILRDPWEIIPMQHSWEGACWRGQRNVGMMWMRSDPGAIAVQRQFLEELAQPTQQAPDEILFGQVANRMTLDTFCVPENIDGLGCNGQKWEKNVESGKLWGLHAACHRVSKKARWIMNHLSRVPNQTIYVP